MYKREHFFGLPECTDEFKGWHVSSYTEIGHALWCQINFGTFYDGPPNPKKCWWLNVTKIQIAEAVFENILSGVIEWPEDDEALSGEAVKAITSLLNLNPEQRSGFPQLQVKKFHMPLLSLYELRSIHSPLK